MAHPLRLSSSPLLRARSGYMSDLIRRVLFSLFAFRPAVSLAHLRSFLGCYCLSRPWGFCVASTVVKLVGTLEVIAAALLLLNVQQWHSGNCVDMI